MTSSSVLQGPPLACHTPLEQLLHRGLQHPDPRRPALISRRGVIGWQELDNRSAHLAGHYLRLGLQRGDRVASLLPNRLAVMLHLLACLRAGLVATPLNYRYTPAELDYALELSGARLLLFHAERLADVAASAQAAALPLGTLIYGAESAGLVGGRGCGGEPLVVEGLSRPPRCFEDLLLPSPAGLPPEVAGAGLADPTEHHDDDPAILYFTSGSTARPKGVTHSRRSLAAVLSSTAQGLGFTPDDNYLAGTSMAHIGGSTSALAALLAGSTVVLARSSDSEEIRWLLEQTNPTVLKLLPAALFALVRDPAIRPADFASLRLCVSGGDHIPSELQTEFRAVAGFPVNELYGMSEVGMVILNPPGQALRPGSLGRPGPGVAMDLRRPDGSSCAPGEAGDLWIRTDGCMSGYWNNPEATAAVLVDGWLASGDVMQADADGYLWFDGRRKQIIVHDSSNICPQDVEDVLLEHPAVAGAGVVGIHDLVHGEDVRAYICLRGPVADRQALERELIGFARDRIGYKAPEQIVVLDDLPLNATGKVDRLALKRLADNQTAPRSGATPMDQVAPTDLAST
ncbi:class I adenylate-forming enzyme family protein [Synechococcus sp. CBW1006]|uniref:class I adenylate-forming enzyme family protein n=1 Tax=Synechococcus sp. CBW1006 TaxID=1353138 RepID=UPI001E5D5B0E|nr:class I adenylate-forming enzyme family protein [Synechococcus sp. CBW1006]